MALDQHGGLWLTDPWLAFAAVVLVVGLALCCHAWLAADELRCPSVVRTGLRRGARAQASTRRAGVWRTASLRLS